MQGFEIEHARRGLVGFELRDIGTVVLVYERWSANGNIGNPLARIDAYLFCANAIDEIDLDRFADADGNARSKFPNVYPLLGTTKIEKWISGFDFRIAIDAKATNPARTHLKGVLESYNHWVSTLGFGPL